MLGAAEVAISAWVLVGGFGLPLGIPPAEEAPLMFHVAPEECVFYATWAGMAKPDPSSSNQTEQLLAEPEVQELITQLERQIRAAVRKAAEDEGPEVGPIADDVMGWVKTVITNPGAVFLADLEIDPHGPPKIQAGALVRFGSVEEAAKLKTKLVQYQTMALRDAVEAVEIAGDTWYRIQPLEPGAPSFTWGVRQSYFIVGVGDGAAEGIMKRAVTDPPAWLQQARKRLAVPRLSTLMHVNVAKIVELAGPFAGPEGNRAIGALGLNNVTALSSASGLDDEGFVSRALIGIDTEPAGIFALVPDKPLTPGELAPIPADSTVALAARLDADAIFEAVLSITEKIDPRAREEAEAGLAGMQQTLGINLRDDLLKPLGDTWRVYNSPSEGGLIVTGLTAVVNLRDAERFAATHEKLLAVAKGMMDREAGPRGGPRIREHEFAGHTMYVFDAGEDEFPLAPSWCIAGDELVVAMLPQNVKAYLSRGDDHRPLTEVPQVAGLFEEGPGPVVVSYYDTKSLFEMFYPMVPMFLQAASREFRREGFDFDVSLLPSTRSIARHLQPGVGAVRRTPAGIEMINRQTLPGGGAATTMPLFAFFGLAGTAGYNANYDGPVAVSTGSTNNMRQILIALLTYSEVHDTFPPAYATDENGNPTVSWRVLILPYLERPDLYDKFKLDEPWDSPHNKPLSNTVIAVYQARGSRTGPTVPATTRFLGVFGESAIFTGKDGTSFRAIRDGLSNTIMVVEANNQRPVPWAKPVDYEYDPENPGAGLFGDGRHDGAVAGFGDGHVQVLRPSIDKETLKAMFTRAGGEVIRAGHHGGVIRMEHDHATDADRGEAIEVRPEGAVETVPERAIQPDDF